MKRFITLFMVQTPWTGIWGERYMKEFTTVVVLREQVRVTDSEWHDFLQHVRYGHVQQHHLAMLRTLLIASDNRQPTDFSTAPWNEARLVTPRHAVRNWNAMAVGRHCKQERLQ